MMQPAGSTRVPVWTARTARTARTGKAGRDPEDAKVARGPYRTPRRPGGARREQEPAAGQCDAGDAGCSHCLRLCIGDRCVDLQGGAGSRRTPVHAMVALYYGDPEMRKYESKGGFAVYMVALYTMTVCDGRKYLVAMVPEDGAPEGATFRLSLLPWVSFLTVYIDSPRKGIRQIVHESRGQGWLRENLPLLAETMRVKGRNPGLTWYAPQGKLAFWVERVEVAHKRGDAVYEYEDETTLALALETHRTTIIMRGASCREPVADERTVSVEAAQKKQNARRRIRAGNIVHMEQP